MQNKKIAALLNEVADKLETMGANPFRIRAYRRAALAVEKTSQDIKALIKNDSELKNIPYIGSGIASYIKHIVKTGKAPILSQKDKRYVKPYEFELRQISGLGAKRIRLLHEQLNINSKEDLTQALLEGKLTKIKGIGNALEAKIKFSLRYSKRIKKSFKFALVYSIIEPLLLQLRKLKNIKYAECVGSYRRRVEIVEDLTILIAAKTTPGIINQILNLEAIKEILNYSTNMAVVILQSDIQLKFYIISPQNYGAALIYFTGSELHYKDLINVVRSKNLKKLIAGATEKKIYSHLDLAYIEPELRENKGEIEAAQNHKLPLLIELNNIKGDLHCHTNETDGIETLEVMVEAALLLGYEYIAITDHSQNLKITNGLDEKRLFKQIKLIDKLNSKLKKITILKSTEVDILEDGSLDLPNSVLKELDLCVCSIHSKFKLEKIKQTERIIKAMDNPYFNILGHPTGRLINSRNPYSLDMEKIFVAAKERNCFMEINAQPSRLDLNENYSLMAKQIGVKFAISSDAHSTRGLSYMKFGIYQARRGWLESADVINTLSLSELRSVLKRK